MALHELASKVDSSKIALSAQRAVLRRALASQTSAVDAIVDVASAASAVDDHARLAQRSGVDLKALLTGSLSVLGPAVTSTALHLLGDLEAVIRSVLGYHETVASLAAELRGKCATVNTECEALAAKVDTLSLLQDQSCAAVGRRADVAEQSLSWCSGYVRSVMAERLEWQERHGRNPGLRGDNGGFSKLCMEALRTMSSDRTTVRPSDDHASVVSRFVGRVGEADMESYVSPKEELALLRAVLSSSGGLSHVKPPVRLRGIDFVQIREQVGGLRTALHSLRHEVREGHHVIEKEIMAVAPRISVAAKQSALEGSRRYELSGVVAVAPPSRPSSPRSPKKSIKRSHVGTQTADPSLHQKDSVAQVEPDTAEVAVATERLEDKPDGLLLAVRPPTDRRISAVPPRRHGPQLSVDAVNQRVVHAMEAAKRVQRSQQRTAVESHQSPRSAGSWDAEVRFTEPSPSRRPFVPPWKRAAGARRPAEALDSTTRSSYNAWVQDQFR